MKWTKEQHDAARARFGKAQRGEKMDEAGMAALSAGPAGPPVDAIDEYADALYFYAISEMERKIAALEEE